MLDRMQNNPHLQRWHCDCLNKLSVGSTGQRKVLQTLAFDRQGLCVQGYGFHNLMSAVLICRRSRTVMLKEGLQRIILLSFPLLPSIPPFCHIPPTPVTHRPGLSFPVRQVSLASGCYPFLDSHNRKKDGSVEWILCAASVSAYLVLWLLCNCYCFEDALLSHLCTQIIQETFLSLSLSLLVLRYIPIRMFFFHFINNGIIRHRTKLSQPEPKETIQWAWAAGGELDSAAISFSLLAFNQCLYSLQLPYPSFVGTVCEFPSFRPLLSVTVILFL